MAGFTGSLVAQYLSNHPQRQSFKFGIAGRSQSKLEAVANKYSLDGSVPRVIVDVGNYETVEEAAKQAKVIISTVGPFWRHGSEVVR